MKKLFILLAAAVVVLFSLSTVVLADPGDEHQNGPAGTQPHNGQVNGKDDSQPRTCQFGESPVCYNNNN